MLYGKAIEPVTIEKIPFPMEEIEFLVDQIIKLSKESPSHSHNENVNEAIKTLNEALRLMTKPILISKVGKYDE